MSVDGMSLRLRKLVRNTASHFQSTLESEPIRTVIAMPHIYEGRTFLGWFDQVLIYIY